MIPGKDKPLSPKVRQILRERRIAILEKPEDFIAIVNENVIISLANGLGNTNIGETSTSIGKLRDKYINQYDLKNTVAPPLYTRPKLFENADQHKWSAVADVVQIFGKDLWTDVREMVSNKSVQRDKVGDAITEKIDKLINLRRFSFKPGR